MLLTVFKNIRSHNLILMKANSLEPDEMQRSAASHLGLHYLPVLHIREPRLTCKLP